MIALELDFCTVDILETKNGLLVLEVNGAGNARWNVAKIILYASNKFQIYIEKQF
ncbi:hypothetical protein KHA80_04265 [Anaerobacillus sp. HL2]|nr:hypothetical protein KHA80_04265 [Anaerobacillus sp. HL2]